MKDENLSYFIILRRGGFIIVQKAAAIERLPPLFICPPRRRMEPERKRGEDRAVNFLREFGVMFFEEKIIMANESFIAKYKKGKPIILPPGIDWPDGTVVTITPIVDGNATMPPDIVDVDVIPAKVGIYTPNLE